MSQIFEAVNDAQLQGAADGSLVAVQATKRGEERVIDFYTHMALQGRAFQVREGTIATGIAASTAITDAQANMCVDAAVGTTIIPVSFRLAITELATATTLKAFLKAVGAASTAGAAFVPLPLLQGGPAATSTARVATAGVTVAAELATTTRRLWELDALTTEAAAGPVVSPFAAIASAVWAPRLPYVGKGIACVYFQVASAVAAVLCFGTLDYIELPTSNL